MTSQRPRRAIGSPIPHTGKHAFLESLHDLLRPVTYLEIGVQFGNSLWLTRPETVAIGIDPNPLCAPPPNAGIYRMTSDEFCAGPGRPGLGGTAPCDMAFIDGSHLVEGALKDFMGVERLARPDGRTVAVFDDVLPYSADIAGRVPLPGDWAGDCWKIFPILDGFRHDLTLILVDVAPTGVLVALGLKPDNTDLTALYDGIVTDWACEFSPEGNAAYIADAHRYTVGPADALTLIHNHLEAIA
jgi:hypothetical protein